LPSPTSPAERARTLIARKESIEAEIDSQLSLLKSNDSTLNSPLVDREGFPRADIDIWAVRHARVRIIELRNDLSAITDEIGKALESVYAPTSTASTNDDNLELKPFAKVNGVAPGSPAASAGLQRDDLVVKFGPLSASSFNPPSSLQPLASYVSTSENRPITVRVLRGKEQTVFLTFVPKQGWGGRGMLGCHIVPYPP